MSWWRHFFALIFGVIMYLILKTVAIAGLIVALVLVVIQGSLTWLFTGKSPESDFIVDSYGAVIEYLTDWTMWLYCVASGDMAPWHAEVEKKKNELY